MGEGVVEGGAGSGADPLLDRLARALPGVAAARRYRRDWLRHDLVAGLVLTTILIPAGMGYAEAIGLPPITGLYASILPLIAYALFGPSRILVVGPDSSLVPLVAAAVVPLAATPEARAPLAALLALLAGGIVVAGGLARLGTVTDLLSIPVRQAYLDGIAVLIIASQLPKLFGFSADGETLPDQLSGWIQGVRAGLTNPTALVLGLASLATILIIRRWWPRIPGILVAVVGATIISGVLDLAGRSGIAVVGVLPQGLPSLALPPLEPSLIIALLPAAVSIALVSAADMSVLSKAYAARGRYEVDEDRELVGLGAANIVAGLSGGFGVSSSSTRTPVAEAAGARSQLTGVVGALAITFLIVFAPGLLTALPATTLAAVVIAAGISLVDVATFARLWRVRRFEFLFGLVCFLGVILVGVIPGIFLAVGLSLLAFVRTAWQPHDAVLGRAEGVKGYHDLRYYPAARQVPGLLLYRFDAPLFFANGEEFARRIRARLVDAPTPVRWVVVAAEPITDVDTTAAAAIEDLLDVLEAQGVTLSFAELKDPVKDRLRRYGTLARIGEARCFPTVGTAVDAYVRETGQPWVDWEEARAAGGTTTPAEVGRPPGGVGWGAEPIDLSDDGPAATAPPPGDDAGRPPDGLAD
jgi:high affinity sulfate transporter 1